MKKYFDFSFSVKSFDADLHCRLVAQHCPALAVDGWLQYFAALVQAQSMQVYVVIVHTSSSKIKHPRSKASQFWSNT